MIWDTRQTFLVLLLLMAGSLSSLSAQTQPDKERVPKATASHRDWTAAKRELFASYWSLEPGWSTELELRNNVPWRDLRMTPVLHTAGGEEVVLAPVDLKPEEIVSLSLRDVMASVRPDLVDKTGAFGSVVFRFDGTAAGNGFAAAVVRREGHPIDFHFDADGIGSISTEGIWWLPAESATDYLILSNPTGKKQTAALTLSEAFGAAHRFPLTLGPWQSVRINIREAIPAAQKGAFGGLSLSVSDKAGLFAAEIVYDEVSGLSTMLKLFDRQSLTEIDTVDSRTLRAPMMALSQPDASLGFPSGTILDPKIFLRNAGPATTAVSPSINWRSESKSGTFVLPQMTLPPGRVAVLRLADFQQAGKIPEDATWGTVNLGYTGRTGELVAVAMSYDKTSRYGSQTPFIEGTSRLFKGSMWHVDGTHNTLITTGNGGTEPTRAQVTLFYNGGQGKYRLEQTLAPGGQIWLNVADLIRNQVPDSDGKTIPPDVMAGSYELRDLDHDVLGLLYEGKLVVDKTYGHASYGCAHCCGYSAARLWQNPFAGPPGIDNPDTYQAYGVCESQWYDMDLFLSPHSSNTAVATLTGQTLHTVAVGSATASGKNTLSYQAPNGGLCAPTPMTGTQPVTVVTLSCTPSVARGGTATCTVAPTGTVVTAWQFKDGSNNTVTRSQNVGSLTWSGVMVTSGTVSATVASMAFPLTASITVTNRNWHTNAASAANVPNGTFLTLPVPPQPTGRDAGLGEFNEDTSNSAGPNSTIIGGDGPNTGYAYFATQLSISTLFQYEINPDLQNSTSQFSTHQWGACGYISWSNLLTQTNRHEFNSSTQSHYAFYTSSTNLSANNPGDFFEQQVALPGADLPQFANTVNSGLASRYNQIFAATNIEPFGVNDSETGTFLGNINYAPYATCP